MALENRLRRTTKPAPNVPNMIAKRVKLQEAWLKPPYQHNGKGIDKRLEEQRRENAPVSSHGFSGGTPNYERTMLTQRIQELAGQ